MDDPIVCSLENGKMGVEEIEDSVVAVPNVAFMLRGQASRIVANWALRVATLPAFRAMPELALDDVQRHIPDVLDMALTAIATSDPTMDPGPLERATELARAHGRARLLDDFTIGDVLAEFNALRRELWSAIWRAVTSTPESIPFLRELSVRVAETFDAISTAAAEAWVDAHAVGAITS